MSFKPSKPGFADILVLRSFTKVPPLLESVGYQLIYDQRCRFRDFMKGLTPQYGRCRWRVLGDERQKILEIEFVDFPRNHRTQTTNFLNFWINGLAAKVFEFYSQPPTASPSCFIVVRLAEEEEHCVDFENPPPDDGYTYK